MDFAHTPVSNGNEYRKRVLAAAAASNQVPDLFARYELSVQEANPDVVRRQLNATIAIWNKETSHPKHGTLVRRLIKEHPHAVSVLTNPVLRERERQDVLRTTQADATKRYQPLEAHLRELVRRHGGIPRSYADDLIQFGTGSGLSENEIRARLEQERLIDDIGATRPMLAPAKFADVQRRLAEYQTATGQTDDVANLFSFIGTRFDTPAHELRNRYEQRVAQNDRRAFGDEKTQVSRSLVDVRLHLLDADPEPYRNSVMREVKQRLLPAIESHKLIDGNITQQALSELERTAVALGLDAGRAAAAVRELACEKRVTITAPAAVAPTPIPQPSRQPPPSTDNQHGGPPGPIDLRPPRPPLQPDAPPNQPSPYWPPPRDNLPPPTPAGSDQSKASEPYTFQSAVGGVLNDPVDFVRRIVHPESDVTNASVRPDDLVPRSQEGGQREAWHGYAFIPLIGPGVAWLMAALVTRSWRMFAWAGFYFGLPLLAIPDIGGVLSMYVILWLAGLLHVHRARARVSKEILSHARH